MVVDEEGQLLIRAVYFGEKHSGRYSGFRRDDDVFVFNAGFGMKGWGIMRDHQPLHAAIFEYSEKWWKLVGYLSVA